MTNPLACPACGYERQPADDGPLSACPSCQVVFAQFRHGRPTPVGEAKKVAPPVARKAGALPLRLICTRCGTETSSPKIITKGSFGMELVLWLLLLVPGMIYSTWRLTTRYAGCPACSSDQLIPLSTPVGQALLNKEAQ